MRAEASVPRSIGNGRECMVYQNFHFFSAFNNTRGQAGGKGGLSGRFSLSHRRFACVSVSPCHLQKKVHTTTTTRVGHGTNFLGRSIAVPLWN